MSVVGRRTPILALQMSILILDISLNVASTLLYWHNTVLLMLFVIQDTCTVMAIIIMFLTFFSTYVFQAGLILVLVARFQTALYASIFYLAISISFHVWSLKARWGQPYTYIWSTALTALYTIQRTSAVVYYYFYKRTVLMLSDPKYHQDSPWLRKQLARK